MNTTSTTAPTTTTRARRCRSLAALALAGGVVATVTACGSVTEALQERSNGHTKTFAYDTGAQGKAEDVLPAWVPDDAEDVRGVFRTTGDETILTMAAPAGALEALPDSCAAVTDDAPLAPHPQRGTLQPADYRTDATLEASWWTAGQEQDATRTCGAWWVGEQDGALFAFTPELRAVEIEDQPEPS